MDEREKKRIMSDPEYKVSFRCANGHSQDFIIHSMPRAWVEFWAGLLDGTSWDTFVHKPYYRSPIGKCAICFAQIQVTVTDASPSSTGGNGK